MNEKPRAYFSCLLPGFILPSKARRFLRQDSYVELRFVVFCQEGTESVRLLPHSTLEF